MIRTARHAALALVVALGLGAGAATQASAASNDINLNFGTQAAFSSFVEEIGAATAYNPASPAETLGTIGLDVGVSLTAVDIDSTLWNSALADGSAPSSLLIPRLHARKGLPFGIDLGASVIVVPSSDVKVIGGELRKALLEGTAATPAVSVLVHYSTLTGVDDLDLSSYGIDLGISKGILMFTPYAGVGQLWIDGSANNNAVAVSLADVSETAARYYVGLKFTPMPVVNIVAQADFGTVSSYTLRANLGF